MIFKRSLIVILIRNSEQIKNNTEDENLWKVKNSQPKLKKFTGFYEKDVS